MKPNNKIMTALALCALCSSASAIEPLATYDAFNGDRINPSLWFGSGIDEETLDVVRNVRSGVLQLDNRSYGDRTVTGGRINHNVRARFTNSNAVHSIAGLFQIKDLELTGCSVDTGTSTQVMFRMDGYFFNDGRSPGPGDATGDIWIQMRLDRDTSSILPPRRMRVVSNVYHCGDPDCNTGSDLLWDTTSLGTVAVGERVFLAVIWDADNERFIFFRNRFAPLIFSYSGVVTVANPPGSTFGKALTNRARIENCIPDPAPVGRLNVVIGHVWVNESAAP